MNETWVYRGIVLFLLLIQNIDCGYSLEKPRPGGSNEYKTINVLSEIIHFFPMKYSVFFHLKNFCIVVIGKFL